MKMKTKHQGGVESVALANKHTTKTTYTTP